MTGPFQRSLFGAIASGIGGVITTPFDVAKSRMMTNTLKQPKRSMWSWLRFIWKEEGVSALFKGVLPRAFLAGLGGFIYFYVFYQGIIYLNADSTFRRIRQ